MSWCSKFIWGLYTRARTKLTSALLQTFLRDLIWSVRTLLLLIGDAEVATKDFVLD